MVKVERAPFTLTRGEVNRTLDAAPGAFLRRIATEVRLKQGRFAGWRIVSFSPRDPVFADGPLHPGDVIVKVNGHTLERPDDLIELWQAMRSAPSLMVELERDGVANTLRWTIVD
jgi:type II secretory pathway component PulC